MLVLIFSNFLHLLVKVNNVVTNTRKPTTECSVEAYTLLIFPRKLYSL